MFRNKLFFALQVLFCQLFAAVALAQTTTLNVGTYNIRCPSNGDTGERDWNQRRDAVVQTLKDNAYDIVGLNECHGGAILSYIEQQLTDYTVVKYSDQKSPGTTAENFNPIFFRTSKFELLDDGVFYLATDLTRPTISWDNNKNNIRFTVWAKLRIKATDEIFYFFETHLDHEGDDSRNEQARINMQQVRTIAGSYPVVLCGDHNSSKIRIPFYQMMGSYMLDARTAATATEGIEKGDGTLSKHKVNGKDFWDPDYHTSTRLDYIWVRGANVSFYKTINSTYGRKQTPSDHFAIKATITLNAYTPNHTHRLTADDNIAEAIANAQAGDTLLVQAGRLALPGSGKTATVKINKSLTIKGGYNADFSAQTGYTELCGDVNHLITVSQNCALELSHFDLHGGNAPQGGATAQGGAIYSTGSMVHLDHCLVHDNTAYSNGGGVYCSGQINVSHCQFYNNTSLYGSGGALYTPANTSELVWRYSVRNSLFYNNKATMGAACYIGAFSQLHVSACAFYHNTATTAGTFYASRTKYDSKVCFVNNTFANNTLTATAVAGLPASNRGGSAIWLTLNGEGTSVALVNNTIVGNQASCLADGATPADFCGAAVQVSTDATVRLYNNIIAGNGSNASTGGDVYLTNLTHVDTQRNVYTTADNCHMNFSDNDLFMSTRASALSALASLLDGEVVDDKFVANVTDDSGTRIVAVKSLVFGTKTINDVPADNYNESRFKGDVDDDADFKSALTTDQRGALRNSSGAGVRGAYEYGSVTAISAPTVVPTARPADNIAYNLQGQRVSNSYRGIVIVNGKKFLR